MQAILTLKTITPLHVGTGQAVGTTDLPIARERATGWPVVPGSGVKGVLKERARIAWMAANDQAQRKSELGAKADEANAYLFGSPKNDSPAAGALAITDLRILLFPARSLRGTFAYVTSPLALRRTNELLRVAGKSEIPVPEPAQGKVWVTSTSQLVMETSKRVCLEDLDIPVDGRSATDPSPAIAALVGMKPHEVAPRLAVVSDDLFTFLTETATEVATHVSLEFETRTARKGFLRSEERVPAEAAFVGLATLDGLHRDGSYDQAADELKKLNGAYDQFGGKASVGNGLCRIGVSA